MAENVQKLSVLIIHEGDLFVAQCLEHDIATQCPTQELALAEFITALVEQIGLDEADGIGPLSKIAAAPDEYRERFESENAKTVPSQTV